MCRYRLVFPQRAGEFDQINIILQAAKNVQVIVTETSTYKSQRYVETYLEVGKSVTATWPNEIFILILVDQGAAGETGDFTISYQYSDLDPDDVINRMTQAERDAYYNQKRITEKEDVSETNTFWYFVAAAVVGAILIIGLLICLCKLKSNNDQMVAKVEKLSEK